MTPLYRDTRFTFRFADDRCVHRFHLEGVAAGRRVTVYRLDPATGEPLERIAAGHAGADGWVELREPLVVRGGEGFIAVAEGDTLVRDETPADHVAVRGVVRAAFGHDDEADLVDALRAGGFVRAAFVAEVNGEVVGHVLFTRLPVETADGVVETLALAPMAVAPEWQRRGVGSDLIHAALAACRERGHRAVVVLGHVEYYPRFGFSSALAERLRSPFPGPHFMALELVPGALDGVEGKVCYAPPFGVD
ncbi:MAG TPA: N-acetyltransferase [Urbifossiella sp.]|nr:N-acetyltransferase [Urbifossiella sp.]